MSNYAIRQLRTSVTTRITDAPLSISAQDVRDMFDDIITEAEIKRGSRYRLEDFGGWGLEARNVLKTITGASTTVTSVGSGVNRRMRIAGVTVPSSGHFPDGASITVTGLTNPQNNGNFWVHNLSVSSGYVEVLNPDVVAESGASVSISWVEIRAELLDFEYNADGTPNPGVVFDNKTALTNLLQQAKDDAALAYANGKPFTTIVDFGSKIFPMSFGNDIKGFANLIFLGSEHSHGGVYWLDDTTSAANPHGLYAIQGANDPVPDDGAGDENTVTTVFKNMFMVGDRLAHTIDYGDLGQSGTGDFIHFDQKHGDDGTQQGTQFPNPIAGVDPQIHVRGCILSGAPRHNIYMRGRGDCHIYDNIIDKAGINGMRLEIYDSKVKGNITTACGENALFLERGGNNVQMAHNHYYFNGTNIRGRLTTADDDLTLKKALSTVYVDFPNVKMHRDRIEDTAGPGVYWGKIINIEMDVDFNSVGTLGPTGSDRIFLYSTIPTNGGTDWFGHDGVPLILADSGGDFVSAFVKALWRTGRAGQFVNYCLEAVPSVTGQVFNNWDIDILPGSSQNATGRPRVDDPDWSDYGGVGVNGPQKFVGYYLEQDSAYYQSYQNIKFKSQGDLVDDFHTRAYSAAFADEINVFDRLVVVETPAPTRFNVTSIADSGDNAVVTLTEDLDSANAPKLFQAVDISGATNGTNDGRFRVSSRSLTNDTLTVENAAAISEGAGAILVAPGTGEATIRPKPIRTVTRYWAKSIGVNGNGDVASVAFKLPNGTTLFTLSETDQSVTTEVNTDGVEEVITPSNDLIQAAIGTGLEDGGVISVNGGDNSQFDITAGVGYVVDNTDPASPVVKKVEWSGFTGVAVTNIATTPTTFVSINADGEIVQENTPPDGESYRDNIHLGSVNHPDNATISSLSEFTSVRPFDLAIALTEFMASIGAINISGNIFSGAASLAIEKSLGSMFYYGSQRNTRQPNIKTNPALNPVPSFIATWRDGAGGWVTQLQSVVVAGVYDDDTTAPYPALGPNGIMANPTDWVNHRIQYSPDSGAVVLHYGQNVYSSVTDALNAINTESFEQNPAAGLVPFRAVLTMRLGATDLSLAGDAVFTSASKIGEF